MGEVSALMRVGRENVVFMAAAGAEMPHFTTPASFVPRSGAAIVALFREVPMVYDDLKLIGHERFVIDDIELPSNGAKEWSGRRADF